MQTILFWIIVLICVGFLFLLAYALCKAAARADKIIEYQYSISKKHSDLKKE